MCDTFSTETACFKTSVKRNLRNVWYLCCQYLWMISHHTEQDRQEHEPMEQAQGDHQEEHLVRDMEESDTVEMMYLEECSEEVVVREGQEDGGQHRAQAAVKHSRAYPGRSSVSVERFTVVLLDESGLGPGPVLL